MFFGVIFSANHQPVERVRPCYSNIYNFLDDIQDLKLYLPVAYDKYYKDNSFNWSKEEIELYIIMLNNMGLFCTLEQEKEHVSCKESERNKTFSGDCYVIDVDCQRTPQTGIKILLNAVRYLFENTSGIQHYRIVEIMFDLFKLNTNHPIHTLFLLAHNLSNVNPSGHNIVPYYNKFCNYSLDEWQQFLHTKVNDVSISLKSIPDKLWIEFLQKNKTLEEQLNNFENL